MAYTPEKIELIDKVSNYYFDFYKGYCRIDNPSNILSAEKYGKDTDTTQWAINKFCKIGHELGILKASKSGYGYCDLVSMDLIEFGNFKNEGGFKKHFSELDKNSEMIQSIRLGDNYGQTFQTVDQSSSSKISSIQSSDSSVSEKDKVKPILKNVLFNPLVSATVAGLIVPNILYYFDCVK
jgi:hypothetical protein